MMLSRIAIGLSLVGFISMPLQAGEKCCGAKKSAGATSGSNVVGVDVEETFLALAATLPTVQYRIGEETTCCSLTANKAREAGKPVSFMVGKEEFKTEAEADARARELTASRLAELRAVRYVVAGEETGCSASAAKLAAAKETRMEYTVGGIRFDSAERAQLAAERVKSAGEDLKISYKVGEKPFCCSKMAGAEREKSERLLYVVGDEQTCCEREAEYLLAKARVQAIVNAAASS